MGSPEELADAFRARGLKLTPQRQLLFRLLHGNTEHLTADAIHARAAAAMPGISLRTVYTILNDLIEMGEIQPVNLDGGATRFDANITDHHHLVCDGCGRIADLDVDVAPELPAHALDGFVAASTSVVVRGLCATCVAESRPIPGGRPSSPTNPSTTHEETSPCLT